MHTDFWDALYVKGMFKRVPLSKTDPQPLCCASDIVF